MVPLAARGRTSRHEAAAHEKQVVLHASVIGFNEVFVRSLLVNGIRIRYRGFGGATRRGKGPFGSRLFSFGAPFHLVPVPSLNPTGICADGVGVESAREYVLKFFNAVIQPS